MYYTVYQITNLITGKIYIGKHQTNCLDDGYMGSGKLIRRSIQKHGVENFEKEILYVFNTEGEMNAKEAELVTEDFCFRDDTYNICLGGNGGFGYINRVNPSVRNGFEHRLDQQKAYSKMGVAEKERRFAEDLEWSTAEQERARKLLSRYGQKGREVWKGQKHSDETKAKIGSANSEKQKGERNSQHGTFWITNGVDNKKVKATESIPEGWFKGRTTKRSF